MFQIRGKGQHVLLPGLRGSGDSGQGHAGHRGGFGGRRGRTDLAEQLGVEMAATGHHAQPKSQRGDTNVPGVWVAGDLRPMSQQVSVSLGTGNLAALMIDQGLRKREVLPR